MNKATAVVIAHAFPSRCLAAQGFGISIGEIILLHSKWNLLITVLFPNTKITLVSDVRDKGHGHTTINLTLVNYVSLSDILLVNSDRKMLHVECVYNSH